MSKSPSQSSAPLNRAAAPAALLEKAFTRHQSQLLGTLYHMLGNSDDAHDALQETFIKCWRKQNQVSEIENLKAWIFRIAVNTAHDQQKAAWKRKRKPMPPDEATLTSSNPGPQAAAQQSEYVARIRRAITQLREEEQIVFLMRQNGGLTYDEIAESIGIPTGTVKTRMRLALSKLRSALGES